MYSTSGHVTGPWSDKPITAYIAWSCDHAKSTKCAVEYNYATHAYPDIDPTGKVCHTLSVESIKLTIRRLCSLGGLTMVSRPCSRRSSSSRFHLFSRYQFISLLWSNAPWQLLGKDALWRRSENFGLLAGSILASFSNDECISKSHDQKKRVAAGCG